MMRTKCPSCGRLILIDDVKRETHHEAPVCEGWEKIVHDHGGVRSGALVETDKGAERIEPKR